VEIPSALTEPLELAVEIAIPPAIPPSPSTVEPSGSVVPLLVVPFPLPGAAPLELGPRTTQPQAASSPTASPSRGLPTRPVLRTPAPAAAGHAAGNPRSEKQTRPRVARARPASTPLAPWAPRSSHGATSSSASGAASSAVLVGIAALTGFVLLAAPGLGRRIRVARELSPRNLGRSPIDHPG
jgi:hypothetical protein